EQAVVGQRHLANVVRKRGERPALEQVLLDIRCVERAQSEARLLQVVSDRRQRLLSSEVSHHRDDQIPRLHPSHKLVVLVACKKVPLLARKISLEDQIPEARKVSAVPVSVEPKRNLETLLEEALVDVFEAGLILF